MDNIIKVICIREFDCFKLGKVYDAVYNEDVKCYGVFIYLIQGKYSCYFFNHFHKIFMLLAELRQNKIGEILYDVKN